MPTKNKGFLNIPRKQLPQALLLGFVVISIIIATILVMSQGSFDNRQRAYGPPSDCANYGQGNQLDCNRLSCTWDAMRIPKCKACGEILNQGSCNDGSNQCIWNNGDRVCVFNPAAVPSPSPCTACNGLRDINGVSMSLPAGQSARTQDATCFTCDKTLCLAAPAISDSMCSSLPACSTNIGSLFMNYAVGSSACTFNGLNYRTCNTGSALAIKDGVRTCVATSSLPACGVDSFELTRVDYTDPYTMANIRNCASGWAVRYYCTFGHMSVTSKNTYRCV